VNLIPIDAARADMVLADDLRRTGAQTLLASGTRLTPELLQTLREHGVTTLTVHDGASAAGTDGSAGEDGADAQARRQQALERISFLFRASAGDVTSQALFRAIFDYRTGAPSS